MSNKRHKQRRFVTTTESVLPFSTSPATTPTLYIITPRTTNFSLLLCYCAANRPTCIYSNPVTLVAVSFLNLLAQLM